MKEHRRSIVSVFLVLLMTTTAFSVLMTTGAEPAPVENSSIANVDILSPAHNASSWEDIVQPSLMPKIKSKQMVDVIIPTTDVSALYNFIKDYRYYGLIGPNSGYDGVSMIRLKLDGGIVPDLAQVHGVLGVYDPAKPIMGASISEGSSSPFSTSVNNPDSTSSTVEHMADKAWDLGYTGEGVRVATMDSGVDFAHYDLDGQQARVPATAEKKGDIIIESTDGSESGKSFALAYYPVVSGSVVLNTYNLETKESGAIEPANYTVDYSNGIVTFNVDMNPSLQVSANYTYYSPYADWPMAFDPVSMSSYLSSGGSPSGWYVDTSTTDLHMYHPVVIDGVNDFWDEKDVLGAASRVYNINETTDRKGSDPLYDMGDAAFDVGNLFMSTDPTSFYLGFETQASITNMSYGIYIDTTPSHGALYDPESKNIVADSSHRPEFAIYVPHIGVRWGLDASGNLWSENDTVAEPRLYKWSGTSWAPNRAFTTMGTMVIGESVATGDTSANDTWATLSHSNISPETFRLYINGTPFPDDGYSVNWETGNITFASDLPFNSHITADYDYDAPSTGGGDFARTDAFMEFRVPKDIFSNPNRINVEVFTVGDNSSHAQDTTPSDPVVPYKQPNWANSETILSSFAYINSTPVKYLVGDIPSMSGVYHLGYHPDQNLASHFFGRPVAVLLTDEFQAGVYDTVYVDLDDDKDFSDEKPASLFGAYNKTAGILPSLGAKLDDNYNLSFNGNSYQVLNKETYASTSRETLIIGNNSTTQGAFGNTSIVPGTENVYRFTHNISFNNDKVVYTTNGTEHVPPGWGFYLPHGNIINVPSGNITNNGFLKVNTSKGIRDATDYGWFWFDNVTGYVNFNNTDWDDPLGNNGITEFYAYFEYNRIEPVSNTEYTMDYLNGTITMNVAPPSNDTIFTTGYKYTKTGPYNGRGSAYIYKDKTYIPVEIRSETIYKNMDDETKLLMGPKKIFDGDGVRTNGPFGHKNIVAGSEHIYIVEWKVFDNATVYNTTGSESGAWGFNLPNTNIANITSFNIHYNYTNDTWSDLKEGENYTLNRATGYVTMLDSPPPKGSEFYASYTYNETVNALHYGDNYTVDYNGGILLLNKSAPDNSTVYASSYYYYLSADDAWYQDLSGGMVYFISRADTTSENLASIDGQTTFNLTEGAINPASFHVYLNGTLLPSDNYTLNPGTRISNGNFTLKNAVSSTDNLMVTYEYNALKIPYSDVLSKRTGVSNVAPLNGNLVCLFGDFSADTSKGTEVASDIAARGLGKDGNDNTLVKGTAPGAKLIAIRSGDPFNGWYFAAEGYDGVVGTGDEANIMSNTFSYAVAQSGWDIYSRFADYISTGYSEGKTAIISGSGTVGAYGYDTISAPGAAAGVITVGIGTNFHYRNYNPKAPSDLGRLYGDGGPNAHFGEVLPSSGRGPTMTGNPKPDVVATGAFCDGDTPLNVDQNMFSGAWEWNGGEWAWDLWSGDSLSVAVSSGILALVYQAYYEAHGQYPDTDTAKNILKSSADNMNYDTFSQGAGFINAYRACQIAAQNDGISLNQTEWIPGDFHGETYSNFVRLAEPGSAYTQSFNVTNENATPMNIEVKGEVFHKFGETNTTMDMKKFYDDKDTPGVLNIMPYIPEKTELLRVTAYVPYVDGYTNMMEFFDWTDNGNKILEFPAEQNRIEYCINSNILQLTIRDPLSQVHDGLAIQIKDFGGTPVAEPWTIKMEFLEKVDWDWMNIDNSSFVLNGGATKQLNATLSIPSDAPAGTYEGGIYVLKNHISAPLTVGEGYVYNYSDMWHIWDNRYSVNNSAVTGGAAVVLPGSAYFTFIPYHEVFDAPVAGISDIPIINTSKSSYVLWHTVNSTVSGVSNNENPGGYANTSRDWHIMNESATPGKYNYTINTTTHTINLNGWSLNTGERVTIYFLNGSYNLTEGTDFTSSPDSKSITLSTNIQDLLNSNPNSTVVASYIWSYSGGTWDARMDRNLVHQRTTLYNNGDKWNQYVAVNNEDVLTALGGETNVTLGNTSILLGTAEIFVNGSRIDSTPLPIEGEVLTSNAAGGEGNFTLSHGNVVSSAATLYINSKIVDPVGEVTLLHPEWCFDANSTAVSQEDLTTSAVNNSGHWLLNTTHNLVTDHVGITPGSFVIYTNPTNISGSTLISSIDYLVGETNGILNGTFEIMNYNSSLHYYIDYSYYDPSISGGYLAHSNIVEDSYKIYRDGTKMVKGLEYTLDVATGKIDLTKPLGADEFITAAYLYNQYKLFSNGTLTLTVPLNSGDSATIDYSYYPFVIDLPSGEVTFAEALNTGAIITANYTYSEYHIDLINGIVKFNNWIYPGDVITGDYTTYESVIPVAINIPVDFPNVTFGTDVGIIQDMYNNTALYGGNDVRQYYMDIPQTGVYSDPGNRQFITDSKWSDSSTDIDTVIYSPASQTSYSGVEFSRESIGPYSIKESGASTSTSGVFTTTGGPEEVLFSPMNNGLNVLTFKSAIMGGSNSSESFSGNLGLLDTSSLEMDITTGFISGHESVSTIASLERYGISGAAAGPSSPQSYPNEIIYQDDADWSHYATYIDQLCTGKYTRAVEVSDSALIFDTHITSKECPDLDLAVFLDGDSNGDHVVDANDDPSYLDGKTEPSEFVAMCADADADEEVTLVTPAPGTYLVRVFGFDVPGGKNTFKLDITLVQGTGFKVSGQDSGTIPAYQPKDLNITWNFDEDSPDGTFMGAFYIGTYNAPMSMLLPVTLKLERTPPEITDATPGQSTNVSTATPVIKVSYDDPAANTGQDIVVRTHTAPAHLWGASDDEWETTVSKTLVPGSGIDPSATKMYLDGQDMTDEITSTDTVATYTPSNNLTDGVHTVRVVAKDLAGNEVQKSWSFAVDTVAPAAPSISLGVLSSNGTSGGVLSSGGTIYTQSDNYNLTGHVDAGSSVMINGQSVEVGADGSFSLDIPLNEGLNPITIVVIDSAGNRNVQEFALTKDTTAPSLSVSISGARIRDIPVASISGSIDLIGEPGDVFVTVNGLPVVLYADGTFSADIILAEGQNTITIVATDAAGNTATKEISVTVDTAAPSLSVDSIPDTVSTKQITVSGNAEPGSKVYVNGKQVLTSNGTFSTQVSLSSGINLITVSAEDAAGNSIEYSFGVDYQPADELSALTTSSASQSAPLLSTAGGILLLLVAIICLIIGFVASRFLKRGGEEGGAAAMEPVQEISEEEEPEAGISEAVEEGAFEDEIGLPEEVAESEEVEEESEDISDDIIDESIADESPEEEIGPQVEKEEDVDFQPAKPEISLEEAKSLLSTGDMVGAMEIYDNLLEQDPGNVKALIGKAETLNATGKWGKALQSISDALKLDPNNSDALVLKGDIFAEQGKTEMARQAYEQALHIDPSNSEIASKIQKL